MLKEKRTSVCTDGVKRTFYVDDCYYTPDNVDLDDIFNGFESCVACVAYTTIKEDKGCNIDPSTCRIDKYDNGLVGYQNHHYFNSIDEAREDYKKRKKLSAGIMTVGYCDVYLFIKKTKKTN